MWRRHQRVHTVAQAEEAGGYSGLEFVGPQEVPGWRRDGGRAGSE